MHRLVEAEPDENARGAGRCAVGVDCDQPLVDIAEPVGINAVLRLLEQRGALGVGGEHRLERG